MHALNARHHAEHTTAGRQPLAHVVDGRLRRCAVFENVEAEDAIQRTRCKQADIVQVTTDIDPWPRQQVERAVLAHVRECLRELVILREQARSHLHRSATHEVLNPGYELAEVVAIDDRAATAAEALAERFAPSQVAQRDVAGPGVDEATLAERHDARYKRL